MAISPCQNILPIEVSGVTGFLADCINGTYTCTEERINGKTVYLKRGDASKCICVFVNLYKFLFIVIL